MKTACYPPGVSWLTPEAASIARYIFVVALAALVFVAAERI